jgi:hypothetical protein
VGVKTAGIRWYIATTATQQLAVLTHRIAAVRGLGQPLGDAVGEALRVQRHLRPRALHQLCNLIEAPWRVNGGHGASFRPHIASYLRINTQAMLNR